MRTGVRTTLVLFFSLSAYNLTVSAAKWSMEPTIAITTGYNDNIGLRSSNAEGAAEGRLVASTKFSVNTPQSGTSGNLAIDLRRYTKQSSFDRNNIRASLNTSYNLENSSLGLNGSFVRDSTLDSQLDETNVGFADLNRHDRLAGAFWRFNLGEHSNATFNYNYRDVSYEDTTNTTTNAFINFNTHSGSLSINRRMSPRATITGSGSYSLTENDNDVTTTNASLSAGGSYRIAPTLSASATFGQRRTTVEQPGGTNVQINFDNRNPIFIFVPADISNEGSGTTFDIDITKIFERGKTTLSADRNVSTSASGIPFETTHLSWTTHYGITTTVSTDTSFQGTQSETEDVLGNRSTNKHFTAESRITWEITESLRISAIYRFRIHTFDSGADDAVRNAAYLTLRYQ